MNAKMIVTGLVISLVTGFVHGQGTFLYDQQSATDQDLAHSGALIQSLQPIGQSFTPTLFSVGFVQFRLVDGTFGNGLGATFHVNLWSDSLGDGTLLSSTEPVSIPDSSSPLVITTFRFSTPVAVTPGMTYYFQPVVEQTGGDMEGLILGDFYDYPGGTYYFNGAPTPDTSVDLWFREGVVVPEPSVALLILLGGLAAVFCRRRRTWSAP